MSSSIILHVMTSRICAQFFSKSTEDMYIHVLTAFDVSSSPSFRPIFYTLFFRIRTISFRENKNKFNDSSSYSTTMSADYANQDPLSIAKQAERDLNTQQAKGNAKGGVSDSGMSSIPCLGSPPLPNSSEHPSLSALILPRMRRLPSHSSPHHIPSHNIRASKKRN